MIFDLQEHQLAIIEWEDPSTEAGWHEPDKIKPGSVRQVGYVAQTRPDHLVICSAYQDGVLCGDPTIIPWGVVLGVEVVEFAPEGANDA